MIFSPDCTPAKNPSQRSLSKFLLSFYFLYVSNWYQTILDWQVIMKNMSGRRGQTQDLLSHEATPLTAGPLPGLDVIKIMLHQRLSRGLQLDLQSINVDRKWKDLKKIILSKTVGANSMKPLHLLTITSYPWAQGFKRLLKGQPEVRIMWFSDRFDELQVGMYWRITEYELFNESIVWRVNVWDVPAFK